MHNKPNLTSYQKLKDKLVGAIGTPERETFETELAQKIAELEAEQIPIVIFKIDGEGDYILEQSTVDGYGENQNDQLFEFCEQNGFSGSDVVDVIYGQTMTRKQLDELPEWGSF